MIRHRSLLVLTPDLSRSDGNRLLLSLLDELGRAGAVDGARTRVIAGAGGPLAAEIATTADLAAVRVVGDAPDLAGQVAARVHPSVRSLGEKVGVGWALARHPMRHDPGRPDLVWAQGVEALHLAAALPRGARRVPLVARITEGPEGLRRGLAGADPARLLGQADVIVAGTEADRTHLATAHGIDARRVAVHPAWRPGPVAGADSRQRRRPGAVPDDALVVAGAGPAGWRSGTDVFLELARRLPERVDGRPVHLVWIGPPDRHGDDARALLDVRLRGLDARVHLIVDPDDPTPLLAGADVLVVTHREAPMPLAVVDAGGAGVPVAGFDVAGLRAALPAHDVDAAVVAADDVDALAERVGGLLRDPAARRLFGASLRAHLDRTARAPACAQALWADVASRLARG